MFLKANNSFKKNYNGPEWWGPHYWYFLHWHADLNVSHGDTRSRNEVAWLLRNVHLVLPCASCAHEAYTYSSSHRVQFPHVVHNPELNVIYWRDMHNAVNRRLGKPIVVIAPVRRDYSFATWWSHCSVVVMACCEDFGSRSDSLDACLTFIDIVLDSHRMMVDVKLSESVAVIEAKRNLFTNIRTTGRLRAMRKYCADIFDIVQHAASL
ncbi:sulfhydry1 oxidase Erv1 like protein [Heliothis virescens ascovirus 3h]|uniref:Sulfhydryl oxidase n=1 Tax=Heliothis virescens ascovirus 3h TaxID=1268039 RepID=A0A2K8ESA0_9VIRU|nr:sulfhydry1 oxidase Erv1 like protein [Heliothis virescens ascovirus 3h]